MDNGSLADVTLLRKLASLSGVRTSYSGSDRKRKSASLESLLAVLRALGADVSRLDDVPAAYRECQRAEAGQVVEPVLVAWDGQLESIPVRIRRNSLRRQIGLSLKLEDGSVSEWQCCPEDSDAIHELAADADFVEVELAGNRHLPWGYHHLIFEAGPRRSEALVISAPTKAYSVDERKRGWGIFIPLYSLHSTTDWGSGSFTHMEKLSRWAGELGGSAVATLPLLAAFLDSPYEPSPYLPVSKLLWNEFYLDVTRVPELAACESARRLINSGLHSAVKSRFCEIRAWLITAAEWLSGEGFWKN